MQTSDPLFYIGQQAYQLVGDSEKRSKAGYITIVAFYSKIFNPQRSLISDLHAITIGSTNSIQ